MKYISSILRIIEAGLDCDSEKLQRYAMRLAKEYHDDGNHTYAKCIEEKFNPNANIIIQDNKK